jgi:RNA polymerase sigma-70 factor (ECF subfamily)
VFRQKFDQKTISKLKKYVFKKVSNQEEAEEIFQDVLVSASDSLSLFKGKSSFFTWLCGIANHEIADFYRKKKIKTILFSHFPFLETLASEALNPDEKLEKEELRKEVRKVLAALSEGYREVLRLKYLEGLSMAEIAKKAKTTVKAVESKLSRAREAFKKRWLVVNRLRA